MITQTTLEKKQIELQEELFDLVQAAQEEEIHNRTAETRENKAFLAMVNRFNELLKS